MKAEIAVATASGKAYYLIVNELRKRNFPFRSIMPNDSMPSDIKVVITTDCEKTLIEHNKILAYKDGSDIESIVNQALRIASGAETYEKLVIGIDPGEVMGLAVLADGKVIETQNCFGVDETLRKIADLFKDICGASESSVFVKIGDGVTIYKNELLRALDGVLPPNVVLETVSEAGTSHCLNESKHRRGFRDVVSAIRIARRNGRAYQRRKD